MKIKRVDREEWRNLCRHCLPPTIYHNPRWLELIEAVYPRLPIQRLACRDDGGSLRWLLPLVGIKPLGRKRPMAISLPFGNYGGFLAPERTDSGLPCTDALMAEFSGMDAAILEIRETDGTLPGFQSSGDFRRFVLPLPADAETLFEKTISGNARTCIRKADNLGIEVTWDHPRRLFLFQRLYELHCSSHGTPLHHRDWHYRMADMLGKDCEIVLARFQGKWICAVLLLHGGGITMLHAIVRDPEFGRIPAVDKIVWSAMERLVEEKRCRYFDFGRTRQVAGQLFFKRKWGAEEKSFSYSYLVKEGVTLPRLLPENKALSPAIRLWRLIPIGLQRFIGPHLRVRIPT